MADCLYRLVDANLSYHDYRPKGPEFGQTLIEDLPPVVSGEDTTDSISVNVFENKHY